MKLKADRATLLMNTANGIMDRADKVRDLQARGYAPLPVRLNRDLPPVLAVGAHLKNTVAIAVGRQVFLSQHVGDLDTLEARGAFERAQIGRFFRRKEALGKFQTFGATVGGLHIDADVDADLPEEE